MIDDTALYDRWLDASRRAKQPQCTYPQMDTLREFYLSAFDDGRTEGISDGYQQGYDEGLAEGSATP